jgi:PKD repeat protein
MYRLQYRNFGSHQTMVVNHTVDVNGSDRAGVRWYELRNSGGDWSIHQQGTYSPDANHRWMASIAMNGTGDIALGFSVSSTSVYPSIRATGRFGEDALGVMTQGELEIRTGSGYQTHSSGRWGDYSMLAVDPTDDCTFWYTQEYYQVAGTAPWQTRIASFKLRDCGPTNNPPSASIVNPTDGSTFAGTVTIQISASDTEDAAGSLTVEWNVDGGAWQSAAYNSGTGYYEASWNSTGVGDRAYTINARATDSGGRSATDSHTVTVDNVNDPPVASFTFSCSGLTCSFDGTGSSDPDGTIASYAWDFGDGTTRPGAMVDHTYAAAGTYTVTLTVTDDDGATGQASQSVTVSQATGMHVGDLHGSQTNQGSTWTAIVTITVHDGNESPVSNATVSGTWSNGTSGTASCATNGSGQCTVSKSSILKRTGSVKFTVDNITPATLTYNSAANRDPDGDSNGTSITVTKP